MTRYNASPTLTDFLHLSPLGIQHDDVVDGVFEFSQQCRLCPWNWRAGTIVSIFSTLSLSLSFLLIYVEIDTKMERTLRWHFWFPFKFKYDWFSDSYVCRISVTKFATHSYRFRLFSCKRFRINNSFQLLRQIGTKISITCYKPWQ